MRARVWIGWLSLWLSMWIAPQAHAAEVTVAVAAHFSAPLQRLAQAFERATGHTVRASVGATGALYAQVRHGAPFEVFLSADDRTPARLESEGLAVSGTRFVYATGRLVLWSADARLVDAQGAVLRAAPAHRLAVANPKTAPYGAAALQTLQRLGVAERWRPHLVQGENIAQVHQFVASGNAPLGFVALAQVRASGSTASGSAWLVPTHLHDSLRHEAVLLGRGQGQPAAQAFMAFLKSEQARAIIDAFGYEP